MERMLVLAALSVLSPATTEFHIRGWTVEVETVVIEQHPAAWESARQELDNQLYRICRVVPDGPLERLKQVRLWMNWKSPTPGAAFHPSAQWLSEHQMNPEMAGGIEIGNVENFVSWTYEQPWMVLHELAHAYQFKFLPGSFDNAEIKTAFDSAMASHRYDSVLLYNGTLQKAYATTNPMEFFAESTEAYFGQNDFYPFNNAELKTYDPTTFNLLRRLWGDPQKRK